MECTTLTLTPTPPFEFEQTLNFVKRFRSREYERNPAHEQIDRDTLRRVVSVNGEPVFFRVKSVGTVAEPGLEVTLYAESLTQERTQAAIDRVRFFLSLDDDLTPFYTLAQSDPAFSEVVEHLYGYHAFKVLTPFEAACWALIQQRTPNSFAHLTMKRLTELFGKSLEVEGVTHRAFPEASQMLDAPEKRVLEATNNTRKTERFLDLIRAFATADEDFLRTAPYAEVSKWLASVKGIGAWSIDFVMLRGLGRYERTPWTDTGLLDAVSSVYTQGLTISQGSAREVAEHYGWYQGYWAHYVKTHYWGSRLG